MTRAEGFRSILVTVVVVLAAPITVTGLAVAGVSVGDAIEAFEDGSPETDATDDPLPGVGEPGEAAIPGAADGATAPGPDRPSRQGSRDVGRAETVREESGAPVAPGVPTTAPEAVPPPLAPPEDPAAEVPAPAEPAPPAGPLDGLDDAIEDPLGGPGGPIEDAIDGFLP